MAGWISNFGLQPRRACALAGLLAVARRQLSVRNRLGSADKLPVLEAPQARRQWWHESGSNSVGHERGVLEIDGDRPVEENGFIGGIRVASGDCTRNNIDGPRHSGEANVIRGQPRNSHSLRGRGPGRVSWCSSSGQLYDGSMATLSRMMKSPGLFMWLGTLSYDEAGLSRAGAIGKATLTIVWKRGAAITEWTDG
jgi:hypothetical protein